MDATAVFTVHVNEAGPTPLTLTPNGGALPDETVGTESSDLVTVVSGGTAPYSFSISDGAPPDGMELNSETNADGTENITIDGTPTTGGDDSFTLDVSDSSTPPQTAQVKASVSTKKPVAAKPAAKKR
jgi:hypothetical protein